MSEVEKNEEIEFNVEDGVVDSEELRAEDYRKYRELYKLLAKINQLPDNYAHPEKNMPNCNMPLRMHTYITVTGNPKDRR